ncbi:MAG: amidohydrolase family protein [Clostridiaceae bacterium]|nr:amidohydrolase family protein [Clostridiaceae bacterium]
MIIDVHNHPDWHGHDLDRFVANMDKYGIDKTWLLSWECPNHEYESNYIHAIPNPGPDGPISFARCLSYAERCPDRFVLGYAPDPRQPFAVQKLRAAVEIFGVRVCGEVKLRMFLDNWDALDMYRYCGEAGLPVIVHLDYRLYCQDSQNAYHQDWWYGGAIENFENATAACPETNFLGHAPGFWAHISGDDKYLTESYPSGKVQPGGKLIAMLDKYPNLYCDISAGSGCNALRRDPEFARGFLIEYQDRICYGRDYFDNIHQEFLNSLDLPQEVLDKIYFRNALKLVPL